MNDNFKGIWIDGGVWECKDLTIIEKHFLQQIKNLDNENGCYASNAFFSEFFGVTKGRCSQVIKSLMDKKMIKRTLIREGKQIVNRVLNLLNRGSELFKEGSKKTKLGIYYSKQPYLENDKENNKEDNNIINNLREEKKALSLKVIELQNRIDFLEGKSKKEKKEEKSSAKKEVFPPPTEEELISQEEESGMLRPYQLFFQEQEHKLLEKGFEEELVDQFKLYAKLRDKKSREFNARYSYNQEQLKETLGRLKDILFQYGPKVTLEALTDATPTSWTKFFPEKVKNRIERERVKSKTKKVVIKDLMMKSEEPKFNKNTWM